VRRRRFLIAGSVTAAGLTLPSAAWAASAADAYAPVERQPFAAQVRRVLAALDQLGSPLPISDREELERALALSNDRNAINGAMRVLDRHALVDVTINPEGRVSALKGRAHAELQEQGWRVFLVRVVNQGTVTAPLTVDSPQARPTSEHAPGSATTPTGVASPGASRPAVHTITAHDVADRWLELASFDGPPMTPALSGLALEYRIIQLYSRDRGAREATLSFAAGPSTTDLGGRSEIAILFRCAPSTTVQLRVRDIDGTATMAAFTVRDRVGRIYPSRAKRLAPDFAFQNQVYRADGETLTLPAGDFVVETSRGPEYITSRRPLTVERRLTTQSERFQLVRWIDPAEHGWYSGDHHIHAAGCAHYNTPTEGVDPSVIARHVRGEGLRLGEVLTWGPSWYYQKQFFTGHAEYASARDALLRYDIEVSGFPSSHTGHLVLLGLKDQDYPETKQIEDWPTFSLPILKWAKGQGAVTGYAHTGHGLETPSLTLTNTELPALNDNGANEYLVDVTHEVNGEPVVDVLSAVDTVAPAELNLWYHALNVGFRTRIGGETDFPCLAETLGRGRS
jgi:hypothetical protein